jgi:hypothetical protein
VIKSKEWRVSNKVWFSAGFSSHRFGLGFSVDKYNLSIDFVCFWINLEY